MTVNRGGEKHPHFSMVAGRLAARPVGADFDPELKETICFLAVSFDFAPKWEPARRAGGKMPTTFGGRWGENTRPFLAWVFFS